MIRIIIFFIPVFMLFSCDKQKDPSKEEVASFDGGKITVLELQKRVDLYLKDLIEQTVDEGKDANNNIVKTNKKKPEIKTEDLVAAHPKIKDNMNRIKYRMAVQMVVEKIMAKEKLKGSLSTKEINRLFDAYHVAIHIKQ